METDFETAEIKARAISKMTTHTETSPRNSETTRIQSTYEPKRNFFTGNDKVYQQFPTTLIQMLKLPFVQLVGLPKKENTLIK